MAANQALLGQALALAGGLALLWATMRSRGLGGDARVGLAQDVGYVGLRLVAYIPLTAVLLEGLEAAVTRWAPGLRLELLADLPGAAQFAVWFLLVDLLGYLVHRAFHAVPVLWRFHAVHHSQTWVNPLTTTRIHLVELLAQRVLVWAPLAVLGQPDQRWLFWVALDGFWGFLVHSGLPLPLGPLRWLVVSPDFHRTHHSVAVEHRDRNFGERLAVWDTLFGTARHDVGEVATGVDDADFPRERGAGPGAVIRTLWDQFAWPFRAR